MIRAFIITLFMAGLAVAAGAQEPGAEPTPEASESEPAPDYSPPALRFIFRDAGEQPPPSQPEGIAFERFGLVFRWVPIVGAGMTNDGAFGATPSQPVDPFYMLNVSFPATARTAPVPPEGVRRTLSDRRYRRHMLSVTREANERENNR